MARISKNFHEIRDPIHVFIRLDSDERKVVNSRPFQRLRHIHQLALSYLVYPGATHKRFEHSLGVMELAGRVFDVIVHSDNLDDDVRRRIPELSNPDQLVYWRRVLRMAALCHDIGHLPFSHAGEKLLPAGWDHERLTGEIIKSPEMTLIWSNIVPPLKPDHVLKLAIGREKAKKFTFTPWEEILSEIVVGDAFGVDRMDYLLRDAYHAGVAYGKFDHYRLIDTLRILVSPSSGDPALGVEEGGIHSAEALLLARYFMYTQVYFHRVRRIYDLHLQDFLVAWKGRHGFPTDLKKHLALMDPEIHAEIHKQAMNPRAKGHLHARRIVNREHFRLLYEWSLADAERNREIGNLVHEAAKRKFGVNNVRRAVRAPKDSSFDFPVLRGNGEVASSTGISEVLAKLPAVRYDYIFIKPGLEENARDWLKKSKEKIMQQKVH